MLVKLFYYYKMKIFNTMNIWNFKLLLVEINAGKTLHNWVFKGN